METKDIADDAMVIEWLDTIEAKPNTSRNYVLAMKYFSKYTGKAPTELIKEARDEIRKGLFPGERSVKGYLVGFRKYLKEERKAAPNTVKINMRSVYSFFTSHDIEIPKLKRSKKNSATALKENLEIPTREDIQAVLTLCDPLEKAIVWWGVHRVYRCMKLGI